jgi:hypothetical protein
MNKVYMLVANLDWGTARFFSTQEKACAALKEQRNEIVARGVHIVTDTDTEFRFYFGWSESGATWRVRDVDVE